MTRATVRELEKKKIKLKGILNKEDVRTWLGFSWHDTFPPRTSIIQL
jgi:isopentenyl diphosphate isomerase/L-lactate dehydrogenase-like FMN-dependent dehydrogenase